MKHQKIAIVLSLAIVFVVASIALPIVIAQPAWNNLVVDHRGSGGSLAIDSHGNPQVLYSHWDVVKTDWGETTAYKLNYVFWTGSSWSNQSIDASIVGAGGDLALDSNDRPHTIFRDRDILKHAFYDGKNWTVQTIDSARVENDGYAWVLDSKGNPHVVYTTIDEGINTFKYSYIEGTNWITQNIDTSNATLNYYHSPSLVLDSNNSPHIICLNTDKHYFTENASIPTNKLVYVSRSGSGWSRQEVASNVASIGNIAIDFWGNPSFTYDHFENLSYINYGTYFTYHADGSLNYVNWNGFSWVTQNIDFISQSASASGSFLHFDSNGNPQFLMYSTYGLICAQWTGTSWTVENLGSIPSDAHFYEGTERIEDFAFDRNGNLCFLYDGEIGTLRSAGIWGGLTFATVKVPSYFPIITFSLVILVIIVLVVVITGFLLYRRHKKANATKQSAAS
jgi:hypothetical protein